MSNVAHHRRAEPSVHTLDDVTALIDQIVNLYDGSNWRKTNARLQGGYLTKWTSSAKVFVYSTFAAIARPVPSTTTQFYLVTDEFEPLHEFFSELLRTLTIGQRQPTRFLPYLGAVEDLDQEEREVVKTLYSPITVVMRLFAISHLVLRPSHANDNKAAFIEYLRQLQNSGMKNWLSEIVRGVESRMARLTIESKHSLCREVNTLFTHLRQSEATCDRFKQIMDENVDFTAREWNRINNRLLSRLAEPECYLPIFGQLLQSSILQGRTTIFGEQTSHSLSHRRNPDLTNRQNFIYDGVRSE